MSDTISDINNSLSDINNSKKWYHYFELMISLIPMNISLIIDLKKKSLIWIDDITSSNYWYHLMNY